MTFKNAPVVLTIGTKKSPLLLISLSNNGDFLIFKNLFFRKFTSTWSIT